jgi:hypothetical protein
LTANGFEQPGALTVAGALLELNDTIARLGPIRANSQLAQPLFMATTHERVVYYTEEVNPPRLQIVDCDNRSTASVSVDSLGRQQWYEATATGFSLHPSEPPRPSGLAITRSGILWATQMLDGPAAADSLTLISLVTVGEDVQRVIGLQGWFQMLDSDGDGRLVLGTHEPVPRVLVVSVSTLMSQLDEHGIDVRKGAGHGSAARR